MSRAKRIGRWQAVSEASRGIRSGVRNRISILRLSLAAVRGAARYESLSEMPDDQGPRPFALKNLKIDFRPMDGRMLMAVMLPDGQRFEKALCIEEIEDVERQLKACLTMARLAK